MKVECIKEVPEHTRILRKNWGESYPVVGQVYHVRNISKGCNDTAEFDFYRLMEIRNPIQEYENETGECKFDSRHFRRITDISALTQLTKVRELEDA